MDYKVITGSSTTDFVNQLQAIVLQGFSPVGDLHNSRAGQLIISVQKLPYVTTTNIAVVIQPTNGQLEADCDALAQVGFIAHGAVLVKDGEYLVQLMTVYTLALPAAVIAGLSPYGQGLIGQVDAVSARTYLGAGTSNLVLGEVAGTAKEGDYQPQVGDLSDATATGIALFKAATALEARNTIGAGTSSLVLGTTAGTAKEGNYTPLINNIEGMLPEIFNFNTALSTEAARAAIGAGTSDLVIGTTVGTAKDGAYQPASTDITDSTAVGRSVLTASTQANARTAIGAGTSNLVLGTTAGTALEGNYAPTDAVYRASFTTTGATINQFCNVNNTAQAVTYNAEAIPNASLGTLVQATGVFTFAVAFRGLITFSAQMMRTSGILGSATWIIQIETSPDGVVWTPSVGSARRTVVQPGDNNLLRVVDMTVAVDVVAGTRVRLTQASDNVASNVGLIATASGNGMTTSAGLVFSLYTVK